MKIETIASVEANPEDALTNRAIELDQRCKGGVCENLAHVLATA